MCSTGTAASGSPSPARRFPPRCTARGTRASWGCPSRAWSFCQPDRMRSRRIAVVLALVLALVPAVVQARGRQDQAPPQYQPIAWHRSIALGAPWGGRLAHGVQLPPEGPDFFTWDPILDRSPDRGWRRWGHVRLIRTLLRILSEYRLAHPEAPRVGIEDIARPHGGPFGERFGGVGHQ